ncbi:hypothetical protein HK104_007358, partial [Borealophlyctis nickersoniae]
MSATSGAAGHPLASFKHIVLSTSNLARSSASRLTFAPTSRDELVASITDTLLSTSSDFEFDAVDAAALRGRGTGGDVLEIGETDFVDADEDRDDLHIAVKLFIPRTPSPTYLTQLHHYLTTHLNTTTIDSLTLQWTHRTSETSDASTSLAKLVPLWRELENAVRQGWVKELGVAGMSGEEVEAWCGMVE